MTDELQVANQQIQARDDFDDLPIQANTRAAQRREAVVSFCRDQMKYGVHYDVLPAEKFKVKQYMTTDDVMKDTNIRKFMTQAGADMLTLSWSIRPEFTTVTETTDYAKPFFYYKVRCTLFSPNGRALTSAEAVCSSEESGFKIRWLTKKDVEGHPDLRNLNLDSLRSKTYQGYNGPVTKYAVTNPDLGDQAHNVYMKAQKRAKVASVRQLFAIGDLFNQPIEDWVDGQDTEGSEEGDGEQEGSGSTQRSQEQAGKKKSTGESKEPPRVVLKLQELFSERCESNGLTERADMDEKLATMWGDLEFKSWRDITDASRGDAVRGWIDQNLPAQPGQAGMFQK